MQLRTMILTSALIAASAVAAPKQVGTMPVPVITDLTAVSGASFDAATGAYRYDYTVTSGPGNKGDIESFLFDDTAPVDYVAPRSSASYTLWRGAQGDVPFDQERDSASYIPHHFHGTLVELGIQSPPGWMGSVTADGEVGPFYLGGDGTHILSPGTSLSFIITSPDQPVIKELDITPDWMLSVDDDANEEQEGDEAVEVEQEILIKKPVLAPGPEWPGSPEHWKHFRADVAKAAALGWIKDTAFAQTLETQLAAAQQVRDVQGGPAAVPALRTLLAVIEAGTPAQRNDTALALLKLNTEALIAHAADTPASKPTGQFTPRLSLTPEKQNVPLGGTATVTARLVDQGKDNAPISGYSLELRALGGAEDSQTVEGVTDASGKLSMTLTSKRPGIKMVELRDHNNLLFARIDWGGGPNLMVGYFFPPAIRWAGQAKISVQDLTENAGNEAAGPSVTRYYASTTSPVDPKTARVVGERSVPALPVDGRSYNQGLDLTFPADLPPGLYFMIACADADNQVAEGDEGDNCVMQGRYVKMPAAKATH